ncbi:MAG TPA: DUF6364 family protein [Chitinophagaceae bacterium]|nr:DUF6364 family protein [Chitinophagaceae bacterium]
MKARLNLTIEETLLDKVKDYAAKQDSSVSEIVEAYFEKIVEKRVKPSVLDLLKSMPKPKTQYPGDFDFKKEYYEERKERYGF